MSYSSIVPITTVVRVQQTGLIIIFTACGILQFTLRALWVHDQRVVATMLVGNHSQATCATLSELVYIQRISFASS